MIIILLIVVFYCLQLNGMDIALTSGNRKQEVKFTDIPKDVFRIALVSLLDLKSIFYLSKTCKKCRSNCTIRELCCSPLSTHYLKSCCQNYIRCTKLITHVGKLYKKYKKKEEKVFKVFLSSKKKEYNEKIKNNLFDLFNYLWSYDCEIRNKHIVMQYTDGRKEVSLEDKIKMYQQLYTTSPCFEENINKQIMHAIRLYQSDVLYVLLSNNPWKIPEQFLFNFGAQIHFFRPRNELGFHLLFRLISDFLDNVTTQETILIRLFQHSTDDVLCWLFDQKILKSTTVDKNRCTLLHYAARYNYPRLIQKIIAVDRGIIYKENVWNRIALDYAVKYKHYNIMQYFYDTNNIQEVHSNYVRFSNGLMYLEEENRWLARI